MPVEFKNYYAILGVNSNASDAEIKEVFRSLARKHHPESGRKSPCMHSQHDLPAKT